MANTTLLIKRLIHYVVLYRLIGSLVATIVTTARILNQYVVIHRCSLLGHRVVAGRIVRGNCIIAPISAACLLIVIHLLVIACGTLSCL